MTIDLLVGVCNINSTIIEFNQRKQHLLFGSWKSGLSSKGNPELLKILAATFITLELVLAIVNLN